MTHKRVVTVVISFWVLSKLLSLAKRFISNGIENVLAVIVVFCLLTTALLNFRGYCDVFIIKFNRFRVEHKRIKILK